MSGLLWISIAAKYAAAEFFSKPFKIMRLLVMLNPPYTRVLYAIIYLALHCDCGNVIQLMGNLSEADSKIQGKAMEAVASLVLALMHGSLTFG